MKKNFTIQLSVFALTLLVGASGCEDKSHVKMPEKKAPEQVEDLRKNPAVPPGQAAYLMGGGTTGGTANTAPK
ncbi:MAG: hypothetical protein OHK0029_08990 [Armatimonadaceae bacterium]